MACGSGSPDTVEADVIDSISVDCETVDRGPPVVTTGVSSGVRENVATVAGSVNPAQAKRAFNKLRKVTLTGRLTVTDVAGHRTVVTRKLTLRR